VRPNVSLPFGGCASSGVSKGRGFVDVQAQGLPQQSAEACQIVFFNSTDLVAREEKPAKVSNA